MEPGEQAAAEAEYHDWWPYVRTSGIHVQVEEARQTGQEPWRRSQAVGEPALELADYATLITTTGPCRSSAHACLL
eukprot:1302454-Amphidinium_carterae.1